MKLLRQGNELVQRPTSKKETSIYREQKDFTSQLYVFVKVTQQYNASHSKTLEDN